MNRYPLVSIVTPSYNQAQFLEQTILSVLSQDYPNLEYIIIDGGSSDGSIDIIRKYERRLSYWISEPDKGQSDAINKGWRISKGEFLAYLNSDDTYEPGAVSAAVETFQNKPEAYLVYGDMYFINEEGRMLRRFRVPAFDLRTFIGDSCYIRQPTTFFRRAALAEVGMLDESMHYAFDYDFFIRICARFSAHRIPRVMANFRRHPASKTVLSSAARSDFTFWPEERALLEKVAHNPRFQSEIRALAWRHIAVHYYKLRNMGLARRMFLKAMRTYPLLTADLDTAYLFVKSLLGGKIVETASQINKRLSRENG